VPSPSSTSSCKPMPFTLPVSSPFSYPSSWSRPGSCSGHFSNWRRCCSPWFPSVRARAPAPSSHAPASSSSDSVLMRNPHEARREPPPRQALCLGFPSRSSSAFSFVGNNLGFVSI
jgi:hypothetical protein